MPLKPSFFFCKRPEVGASSHDMLRDATRRMEGADAKTMAHLYSIPGDRVTRIGQIAQFTRELLNGVYVPEALARKYPAFGQLYNAITPVFQRLLRVKQVHQHAIEAEMELRGITPGSARSNTVARLLNLVRKDTIISHKGSRPLSNADLRAALMDFAEGKRGGKGLLPDAMMDDIGVQSMPYFQDEARHVSQHISDRDLDFARKIQREMQFSWELNREVLRKLGTAKGLKGENLTKFMDDVTGKELDSYFPHMRAAIKTIGNDLENSDIDPTIKGMFTHEMKAIDALYGTGELEAEFLEEARHLAKLLAEFRAGGKPARDTFSFINAQSNLGITARSYAWDRDGFTAAMRDLFDLRGQTGATTPLEQAGWKALEDLNRRPGSLIAMMSYVPSEIKVRFYKRRMQTARPWIADVTQSFPAYMNATLKFAHIQPILEDVVTAVERAQRETPEIAPGMIRFINDLIGNPHRASRVALNEMGKILSLSYNATLGMNLSAGFANYLGQTGFIVAENGLTPTMVAWTALAAGARKGSRFSPMIDLLDQELIGLESRPFGSVLNNVDEAMQALRGAESMGEAMRISKAVGLSAADFFGRSEQQVRKVSYLAGLIKFMMDHPDPNLRWSPMSGTEQLTEKFSRALAAPGGRDALALAGEESSSKAAFLFGNSNAPELIRWARTTPGGIGASITMFSNYPIQAFSRIGMWLHDAGRLRPTWAGGFGHTDTAGKAAMAKLTRFFSYGVLLGGPFFLAPVLRDMVISGDRENARDLKNFFVEWEKHYSLAGLAGDAVKQVTGEYNTLDVAGKTTLGPSAGDPFGPLGALGGGPIVQATTAAIPAISGTIKDFWPGGGAANIDEIRAREKFVGGYFENKLFSGLGNLEKVVPDVPASTVIPSGVFAARLATTLMRFARGGSFDAEGRLTQPINTTREVIRQMGRPLDEVLASTESRAAAAADDAHMIRIERAKKAILEANAAALGDVITEDFSVLESLEKGDIDRLFRDSRLVASARAVSHLTTAAARRQMMRSARLLSEGNLTPAEEFEEKQKIAVLSLRFLKEDPELAKRLRQARMTSRSQ